MKILQVIIVQLLMLLVLPTCPASQASTMATQDGNFQLATTPDGKWVILHQNGTWEYSDYQGEYSISTLGITDLKEIDLSKLLKAKVKRSKDGDTFVVVIENPPKWMMMTENLRFLGIDAEEMRTRNTNKVMAEAASKFTERALFYKTVYLMFEADTLRDGLGRLLAFVFLENGDCFNLSLIEQGYAKASEKYPCTFHQDFLDAMGTAEEKKVGIWAQASIPVYIQTIFNDHFLEYLVIGNRTEADQNIGGWRIVDKSGYELILPRNTKLKARGTFRIYSGKTEVKIPENAIHPIRENIWNNGGDRAYLYDDEGHLIDQYSY